MSVDDRWEVWSQPSGGTGERGPEQEVTYRGGTIGLFARRFRRNRLAAAAAITLLVVVVASLIAPVISPADPNQQDLARGLEGPSWDHLLGTDNLGRDILSRLLHAGRISLVAAAEALGIALLLGVPFGFVAGYARGRVDAAIGLVNDAVMALPPLILAVALVGALGRGLGKAMLAVGIVFAPRFLRLVRGTVISLRERAFVEASVTCGTTPGRVIVRHLVPNALSPLLVQIAFTAGFAILAEASLSFLGLGVQLPDASWGSMLSRAFQDMRRSTWQLFPPGIAIAVTVLALNLVGDGIRDAIGQERGSAR